MRIPAVYTPLPIGSKEDDMSEHERLMLEITNLYADGYEPEEIALRLRVSPRSVIRKLKLIKARAVERLTVDVMELVSREDLALRKINREMSELIGDIKSNPEHPNSNNLLQAYAVSIKASEVRHKLLALPKRMESMQQGGSSTDDMLRLISERKENDLTKESKEDE